MVATHALTIILYPNNNCVITTPNNIKIRNIQTNAYPPGPPPPTSWSVAGRPKHVARRRLWRALFCGSRYPRYVYYIHIVYTCTVLCRRIYYTYMRLCCSFGPSGILFSSLTTGPRHISGRADEGVCNENNNCIYDDRRRHHTHTNAHTYKISRGVPRNPQAFFDVQYNKLTSARWFFFSLFSPTYQNTLVRSVFVCAAVLTPRAVETFRHEGCTYTKYNIILYIIMHGKYVYTENTMRSEPRANGGGQ